VVILFAATALFHLANAPVMPLVALYVKQLQGSDRQVAAVVLVAQTVTIPVALLTGGLCDRWGVEGNGDPKAWRKAIQELEKKYPAKPGR
jgi:hypothetical protein